jgi:hypothetical protein
MHLQGWAGVKMEIVADIRVRGCEGVRVRGCARLSAGVWA